MHWVCPRSPSTAPVRALSPWRRITTDILFLPTPVAYASVRSSPHYSLSCSLSLRLPPPPGSHRFPATANRDMVQDYEEALSCLSSLITRRTRGDGANRGDQFDLTFHYVKILDLEDEISRLKVIHVAGTKGKGSTCTFTESILRSCGFRTGLFTSPHLIDVRERFRLDGVEVSQEKFLKNFWWCWNRLQEKTREDLPMPTYFRFLALIAFKIFSSEQVDVAIMEVGLGGRFDATNVVKKPVVCGISSLGYDHMEILGNTLGEIAGEKAGIFKKGVPAYTVPQPEEAIIALEDKASQLGVPLQIVLPLDPRLMKKQHLGLDGEHQYINAGLAVALSSVWLKTTGNIKDMNLDQNSLPEQFLRGLARANFEGRAQIVSDDPFEQLQNSNLGGLTFYLDGAHSPESLEICAKWFSRVIKDVVQLEDQRIRLGGNPISLGRKEHLQILLFNCMSVRDPQRLLPCLVNTCSQQGVKFCKAIFVPNQSVYNKVTSHATPTADIQQVDLSWQLKVQRVWENIIHSEQGSSYTSADGGSLVFPSLPLAIKWLRESVQQNKSAQYQVLVTGSLHLVGDVLRLIRQ